MRFDPTSAEFFQDPTEMFRWLLEEHPLYYNEDPEYYAISRYTDVFAALGDWRRLSNAYNVGLIPFPPASIPGNILSMDPPEHDRIRRLLSKSFTPRAIDAYEPLVRSTICSFLDELEGRDAFDIVADFSTHFPVEVISTLLGVPKADRRMVRNLTAVRNHREPGEVEPSAKSVEALATLLKYFTDLVADRRKHLGEDMISALCRVDEELEDGQDGRISDAEIVGFARLLGSAGSETVTKLVGNGVVLFHRNPDQWAKVLDDPTLIPKAVEEIVRYWPPTSYLGRQVMEEVEFSAGTVPAGTRLLLVVGAATRDPLRFDNSDAFDIERDQHRQIGFGFGVHVCIGAHLARMESRIAFEEIRRRWPRFEVDEAGLTRVSMSNVSGYHTVPITVGRHTVGARG